MKEIVIGLLKSNHPIKLKKALVEKLSQNGSFLQTVKLSELIFDLELLWSIQPNEVDLNQANFIFDLKKNYECLNENCDILKQIFILYAQNFREQPPDDFNFDVFENHLLNLFKLTFMPNLNRASNSFVIKNKLILLMQWLRLIVESFYVELNRIEAISSLINILHMINLNLSKFDSDSINFYYFIQNDTKFGYEYLTLVRACFDHIEVLENLKQIQTPPSTMTNGHHGGEEPLIVESCLFESICLMIKSVSVKQILSREQKLQIDEQLREEQNMNFLNELFHNVHLIVEFLKWNMNRSHKMFELCLKYLIDILCVHSSAELNPIIAQLFNCFDIGIVTVFIKNYFAVSFFIR